MLSQRDKDFISYWEANRVRRKKTFIQFLIGIPVGLLFVIPIVINFSSGWYKRADMEANSSNFNPMVLFVALLLILGFTAIFYQRHKWDQYEQHYRELLARQQAEESEQRPNPQVGQAEDPQVGQPEPSQHSEQPDHEVDAKTGSTGSNASNASANAGGTEYIGSANAGSAGERTSAGGGSNPDRE